MTVHVKNKAKFSLSDRFASMVGFDEKELEIAKNTEARLPVDLEAGFHAMYLYTDIFEPQLVGDSNVSLLKVVKCSGEFGENVNVSFPHLQYVPVSVKSFEIIEIDIKDDTQEKGAYCITRTRTQTRTREKILNKKNL